MKFKNDQTNYGLLAQSFHWLMALLIFWAIALGKIAEEMPSSPEKVNLFVLHKSAGISVLVLLVLRLLWRFLSPPPSLGLSPKQEKLAHLGHWGLYGLMLAVPLSGYLLNSAAGYPFAWFHLISVPVLPISEEFKGIFGNIHVALFYVLAAAVLGHIAMLFHHKFAHNKVFLPRMLPGQKMASGVVLILVLCALLVYTVLASKVEEKDSAASEEAATAQDIDTPTTERPAVKTDSPLWQMVAADSELGFIGRYSGEPFDGEFKSFDPKIYFDPQSPEDGVLDVTVNTTSVTTYTSDWDMTLSGGEWFAFSKFSNAYFFSDDIEATANGFVARGVLTLKGISEPVVVNFEWKALEDDSVNFVGEATLDRRTFNIGSGDWKDDESVGFNVDVKIDLTLELSEA